MANWTLTNNSFTTTSGSASSEQDVVLTISPAAGYNIEAKNFKVGGGVETNGSMVVTPGTNIWEARGGTFWNADSNISKVVFTNVIAADQLPTPDNTVLATITVTSFTPSVATKLYVDIDERDDNPIVPTGEEPRNICLETRWDYSANHTVTQTSLLSSVTSSDVATGDASNQTKKKLSGNVPNGTTTKIATIKFESASEFHYQTGSGPTFGNLKHPSPGIYEDTYSWGLEDGGGVYVGGKLQEITFNVSHTPPDGYDEPSDVCPFAHFFNMALVIVPDEVAVAGSINSVAYPPKSSRVGGSHTIQVHGTVGAAYSISIQKKTSTTSDVTAASNGHYNFVTRQFQTSDGAHNSTINSFGVTKHQLVLPPTATNTRYDITISGLVDGVQTTLASGVPVKAGDATITQFGANTLTLTPITNTASDFGTLPADVTIGRPIRFKGDGYSSANTDIITLKGGTAGVSSTRLTLDKYRSSIKIIPGMIVTGSNISHNTTVSAVNGNIVTLSGASTIAASTDITFASGSGNIMPFSFTVVPNATPDALTVTAVTDLFSNVGGLSAVKNKINGTAAKTVTHTLDSTKGIVPGMVVTGDQVYVAAGTDLTVASVTNGTVIVLSEEQSFVDNANLKFSGGNASSAVSVHSMQVNKVGDNIVITGYINATSLGATAQARIYIDDLITVA